jgi:outer membrane protein OmpA-like peptidoglycan-associated protein
MKRALALCSLLAMVAACAPVPPPPPPPPPMAMAPAPAPANTFIVFFDWNRSWVTPEGMQILKAAAAAYHAGGNVTVHVTGYTDTSGSAAYNQRLSERRAWHVARVLEHLGVPHAAMVVTGRGENDLRVPTANGVREPQNRRVEVVEG